MRRIVLQTQTDWEGWRHATRAFVAASVEPAEISWSVGGDASPLPDATGTLHVPRVFVSLASQAIQARDSERFGLLYSLIWRINAGEKPLLDDGDPDLARIRRMALAVRADAHRMRTNMRFMPVPSPGGTRLLSWFDPQHHVLRANAQLTARRFPHLILSIVTPDESAHWDGTSLRFSAGLRQPADDVALQAWWETHGDDLLTQAVTDGSIPETEDVDEAPRSPDRAPLGPVVLYGKPDPALHQSVQDAATCQRCPLYEPATQTVFGEGPAGASVMFVGEQPGDQEDTIGRPFVGPAGQMMDRAMEEAGIDRRTIYVTNAVKHFKFTPRGKRRIHQTPEVPEIRACNVWLEQERAEVRPHLLVLMGASAARAVLGRAVTISRERGRPFRLADGQTAFVTVHPSYLLRIPDADAKAREYEAFVNDLRSIRTLMEA